MTWFRSPRWGLWCDVWAIVVIVASAVISVALWGQLSAGESLSSTIRYIVLATTGAIALPLAFWRSVTADRQSKTALQQWETALDQTRVAFQGLVNERYQKGAEMLGSSVLTVRLGGIYALRRLAEEHAEEYHIQIMRLLCAFVRHPTGPGHALGSPVAMDVQDAMNAIGYRSQTGRQVETTEVTS